MGKLGIRGHFTRGEKVIELLESLGGINENNLIGYNEDVIYVINNKRIEIRNEKEGMIVFTIDEFFEKFPYKVGDKVCYIPLSYNYTIVGMRWSNELNEVYYKLSDDDCFELDDVSVKQLSNCKEERKEIPPYMDYPVRTKETVEIPEKLKPVIDLSQHSKDEYIIKLGDYEIKEVDGILKAVRKKQKYPKTYEECCEVLGITYDLELNTQTVFAWNIRLLTYLQQLLICRNAYWKIANYKGSEAGTEFCWLYYNIYDREIKMEKGKPDCSMFMSFPDEYVADEFVKYFWDLLEKCKEFL